MSEKISNKISVIIKMLYRNKGYIAVGLITFYILALWGTKYMLGNQADSLWKPVFNNIIPFFTVIASVSVVFCLFSGIWIKRMKKVNWGAVTFTACMVLGVLYMFILPPLSAPDEGAHFVTAYRLSNQIMGKTVTNDEGRVLVREGDVDGHITAYPDAATYEYIQNHLFDRDESNGTIEHYSIPVNTNTIIYLPQALGITLARLLDIGYVGLAFLARFFNLIVVSLGFAVSVNWIPFGKKVLFAVCTLPMTLSLIGSVSYDGMIMMLSFMFISYCFKLAYEKEKVEWKDILILAVTLGILAPCKIVYTPLVGLCLLIPKDKFKDKKTYILGAATVLGVVILSSVLVNGKIILGYATVSPEDTAMTWYDEGAQGYTLSYLLQNPKQFVGIMYRTATNNAVYYFKMMIGMALGNIDQRLMLEDKEIIFYTLYIVLAALPTAVTEKKKIKIGQKCWIAVLIVVVSILVFLSMLVGWTPMGFSQIEGIQGRYFLPVLPLALLILFKDNVLVIRNNISKYLIYTGCAVNLAVLAKMFGIMLITYPLI